MTLGPQYSGDDDFKARARLHQSRFRLQELGLHECREYGNRLTTRDALAGKNFCDWPGLSEAVEQRFGRKDSPVWYDMLRSEHIPFNLFVPLRDQPWARQLFGGWLGQDVATVSKIAIEWAPEPRRDYLDDNTSFDSYVECVLGDGRRAAIGIEVKYTEGPYSWGKAERARMFDEGSLYQQIHRRSKLYVDGALSPLRTPALKQLWRNQLLGEAMLARADLGIDLFTSVLVYPEGNVHYAKAARDHTGLIVPSGRTPFVPVTLEAMLAECRAAAGDDDRARAWLDYLERRYVVGRAVALP